MKRFRGTVRLQLGSGRAGIEVPATIVGRLAVHREFHPGAADRHILSDRYWQVTHVESGLVANRATPDRMRAPDGTVTAKRAELLEWAERWQSLPVVAEYLDRVERGESPTHPNMSGAISAVVSAGRKL